MNRRNALFVAFAAAASARQSIASSSVPEECKWILGHWRSDVDRSMANFTFQDKRPNEESLKKIGNIFGKMTHEFLPAKFIVNSNDGDRSYQKKSRFLITRFTLSSVSLRLLDFDPQQEMTLYRAGEYYFVRVRKNLEYFKRIA